MEDHWMMVIHSLIIGLVAFIFMIYVLGQKNDMAERRSILLVCVVSIYMILFGHGLPLKLNKI
jgi:hypothetical protein